jgi:hypothetical protein
MVANNAQCKSPDLYRCCAMYSLSGDPVPSITQPSAQRLPNCLNIIRLTSIHDVEAGCKMSERIFCNPGYLDTRSCVSKLFKAHQQPVYSAATALEDLYFQLKGLHHLRAKTYRVNCRQQYYDNLTGGSSRSSMS